MRGKQIKSDEPSVHGADVPEPNLTKYLVGADGRLIAHWPTKVPPEDPKIVQAIEAALPS